MKRFLDLWSSLLPRIAAAAGLVSISLLAVSLSIGALPARAATLDDPLRWIPSSSQDVAGYVVHVGNRSGFRSSGGGVSFDIGDDYALVDGIAEHRLGNLIAADAYLTLQAYDSAGIRSIDSNEIFVTIDTAGSGPDSEPTPDPPAEGSFVFSESFEGYTAGQDPGGWYDTGANNSMSEDRTLFRTASEGGNVFLETTSTATNIHSHLLTAGSPAWSRYELAGRMRITDWMGGIGVTIYSDYANSDTYYRLRRAQSGPTFHLASHSPDGSVTCEGLTNTGVSPAPNTWYRFRFQAGDDDASVRLRARVWPEGAAEPAEWQVDCTPTGNAPLVGAPGVWSMGPGAKQWDDFSVQSLYADATVPTAECTVDSDCLDGDRCNGDEICAGGSCQAGTALACATGGSCQSGSCDPTMGCVVVPVANGTACSDGNSCTSGDSCQSGQCTSGAPLYCADPGPCHSGSCDPATGCTSAPVADGTVCSDGDSGTANDVCQAGLCVGVVSTPEPTPEPDPEPIPEPDPTPDPEPGDPVGAVLFFDDFEADAIGDDPQRWRGTGAHNSMTESPGLFTVTPAADGGLGLSTHSSDINIHSHYIGIGNESEGWWDYEYFGRMRFEDAAAGVGVTLLSDYPNSDSYLRLRRFGSQPTFKLSPHSSNSTDVCQGQTDSLVVSEPGVWYVFRFRTVDHPSGLQVQAKVWDERTEEPAVWQISCTWTGWPEAAGRPGVWSMGPGEKQWDDLGAFVIEASEGDSATPAYAEDFEGLAPGSELAGWLDTAQRNAMTEDPALFSVRTAPDGSMALTTWSSQTNIHSHYATAATALWSDYEYAGRMMASDNSSGIGVTLYSAYPEEDAYYRLRRWARQPDFHLSIHGGKRNTMCVGETTTGVTSRPGVWYDYRFRATNEAAGVRLQAMVWEQGTPEPASWQADCLVDDPAAPRSGAPGVWSMRKGAKFWDDLVITPIEP